MPIGQGLQVYYHGSARRRELVQSGPDRINLYAMADANLFAPWFRDPASWSAWRAFIAALFALPMTPEQLAIYQQCTNRAAPPGSPFSEAWLICGRRAGKS